jgi:hypothetical protein
MGIGVLHTSDPAALAAALREQGLPGQRSKTAITRLRRERARQRPLPDWPPAPSVQARTVAHLTAMYCAEIARRGGETVIDGRYGTQEVTIADRRNGLAVMRAEGWRQYGRHGTARWVALSYLCGREDGQVWAVRVPGTIETVQAALAWLTPAAVTAAQNAGRRVERQGDVYTVETTRPHDGKGELPENHTWDAAARTLTHPQHGTLHLPYPVRFCAQNAYQMGRSGGRAYGD